MFVRVNLTQKDNYINILYNTENSPNLVTVKIKVNCCHKI